MPEGDTIWRTAETLRHALKGKRITAARPDLIKRFTGATVTDVKPVGKLLLDQRVTAGIGNVYRCEALWWQRVNPWTPTKDLNDTDLETLYNTVRQAMTSNLKTNDRNRTFPRYGPAAVHGRGGRPCR